MLYISMAFPVHSFNSSAARTPISHAQTSCQNIAQRPIFQSPLLASSAVISIIS